MSSRKPDEASRPYTDRTAGEDTKTDGLPLREFVSWLPLTAMAVMALNDHLLKRIYPGWWTGKLSDFAGLVYFPLLCTALFNTSRTMGRWAWLAARGAPGPYPVCRLTRRHLTISSALTGLLFASINIWPGAMALFVRGLDLFHRLGIIAPSGGMTDPTDLVALPMLLVSWWWGCRFIEAVTPLAAERGQ